MVVVAESSWAGKAKPLLEYVPIPVETHHCHFQVGKDPM